MKRQINTNLSILIDLATCDFMIPNISSYTWIMLIINPVNNRSNAKAAANTGGLPLVLVLTIKVARRVGMVTDKPVIRIAQADQVSPLRKEKYSMNPIAIATASQPPPTTLMSAMISVLMVASSSIHILPTALA